MVIYQRIEVDHYVDQLKALLTLHAKNTQSRLAETILAYFDTRDRAFLADRAEGDAGQARDPGDPGDGGAHRLTRAVRWRLWRQAGPAAPPA